MSQPEPAPKYPPPSGSLGGCALFVIGMLFLVPSGLCTAFGGVALVGELLSDPAELARDSGMFAGFAALTLGCLAIGVTLVWMAVGRRRNRSDG
ncbi:MAG TPA: hypothetical protein VG819_10710 [Rhizomicrobium sp.]|nr:hypothetical protein [Rhizomicrobium sp.]